MKRYLPWVTSLLFGCGSSVTEDMTFALTKANDAIALSLISTEAVAWLDATTSTTYGQTPTDTGLGDTGTGTTTPTSPSGARHGPAGDCPRITRTPDTGTPFTMTADYRTGCVSGSGLVPAVLSGTMAIASEASTFSTTLDGMDISLVRPILGTLEGTFTDPEQPSLTGAIRLPEEGDRPELDSTLDLDIVFEPTVVWLNGTVVVGGAVVTLEGVRLAEDKISGDCPRPNRGTATLDGDPILQVDFAEPAGDEVTVLRGKRRSQPTNPCGWESRAF